LKTKAYRQLLAGALMLALPLAATARNAAERGEYLTTILGCGGCHTEGALLGEPSGEWLTGSTIGVAYTADIPEQSPGVIFPGNLTPDKETGIGSWSKRDIVKFLRTGLDHYGQQANTVMPWPNYALLNDRDVNAVADYLLSLDPVSNQIPQSIAPGSAIEHPFVRIGVYLFVPEETTATPDLEDEEQQPSEQSGE
jgi:mono/diheme cytochrome c family protein